jgi:hypothetical protein
VTQIRLERDLDRLPRLNLTQGGAGSATTCAEAGLERVFLWPLGEEPGQLELVAEKLTPALARLDTDPVDV